MRHLGDFFVFPDIKAASFYLWHAKTLKTYPGCPLSTPELKSNYHLEKVFFREVTVISSTGFLPHSLSGKTLPRFYLFINNL
jgi:hypothetical protein